MQHGKTEENGHVPNKHRLPQNASVDAVERKPHGNHPNAGSKIQYGGGGSHWGSEAELGDSLLNGKSVAVNANMSEANRRARIDNLGVYHEYLPQSFRAMHEAAVLRSLNENLDPAVSNNSTASQSTAYLHEFHGPITITALMGTSHVFIRYCDAKSVPTEVKAVKGRGLREVWNNENRRIFFLKQTKSTSLLSVLLLWGFFVQNFEFTVLDRSGKPALLISGRQVLFGVHSTTIFQYSDGTYLATMKQTLCDGFYRIYDDKSKVMFTLIGPVFSCYAPCVFGCCDEEFEIFLSGSADEVGRIGKYWDESEFPKTADSVGASFPRSMSLRSKAIVFGACLTIRYQYFVNGGNGTVLVPIYLVGVAAVASILYFNCFSYCNVH